MKSKTHYVSSESAQCRNYLNIQIQTFNLGIMFEQFVEIL